MKNILVSACLLGMACRYDGKSKPNETVLRLLENNSDEIRLIPICPEQLGGLPTPRVPSEKAGEKVINRVGIDVTVQYQKGAKEALKLAKLYHCETAILKERSPSCGRGKIYDGSFTKTLISGDGTTAELLKQNGIRVIGESEVRLFARENVNEYF